MYVRILEGYMNIGYLDPWGNFGPVTDKLRTGFVCYGL